MSFSNSSSSSGSSNEHIPVSVLLPPPSLVASLPNSQETVDAIINASAVQYSSTDDMRELPQASIQAWKASLVAVHE